MATIISVANQKGGVGKTTTAFNLAWALTELNSQVLLIDNDPQGNLTSYALSEDNPPQLTIDEIYVTRKSQNILDMSQLTKINENLFILAADSMLAGVEFYLVSRPDKEYILKRAISSVVEHFDYVIIDNPPALNLLTVNGLVASESVIIPVQLEFFSLEGIVLLQNTIKSLHDRNPGLEILGIIPNMFDNRRKLNWEVLDALKKQFGEKVFESKIHNSVKIAESSGHGKSILSYAPQSRSSAEYIEFAKEVISHVRETETGA
ncbi:MAG: ParA family protein [Oligoflexia bacterium]|nr:ParA family protein [Oligoflexia bacterium]